MIICMPDFNVVEFLEKCSNCVSVLPCFIMKIYVIQVKHNLVT